MKYAMLIFGDDSEWAELSPAEEQDLMAQVYAWYERWQPTGKIADGGAELQPKETAKTVRADANGQPMITDGPGIDRWPTVRLRRELKIAFGPWVVEALDTIDLALTVGGSVTPAEGYAGVHHLRFSVPRRRLTANLVVAASTVAAHDGDVLAAVQPAFQSLAEAIAVRLRQKRVSFDRREFAMRLESAIAAAARPDPEASENRSPAGGERRRLGHDDHV